MVTKTLKSEQSTFQFVRRRLITKEDPQHVHKTLGILVLLSYIWRFSQPWDSEMGFATHPHLTVPTLLLHWSLNLSSFIFHIPTQRIKNGGRIWPEYRLHAMIFLTRSCLAVLIRHVYMSMDKFQDNMSLFYGLNFALVISNMATADWASSICGDKSSRSIRDVQEVPIFVKYYFSTMQFFGTAFIMTSTNFSLVFYYAFVVQLNPFGMTMVRKNIITHEFNMALYALELSMGGALAYKLGHKDPFFVGPQVCAIFAAFWRMGPWPQFVPRNKYLVWIGTFVMFQTMIRPIMEDQSALSVKYMTLTADLQVVVMVSFMLYKQYWEYQQQKKTISKNRTTNDSTATAEAKIIKQQ